MIVTVTQYTDEWYKARLGKFSASDAHVIYTAGKGLDTLCFEKAAELITGENKVNYASADMDRGSELESEARNAYELETGETVTEVGFVVLDDLPQIGCSPDGLVGTKGLIEIKCPNDTTYARYLFDQVIDPKYYAQMQMQMLITETEWCDYVVYNSNFPKSVTIQRVTLDDEFNKKLYEGMAKAVSTLDKILEKLNGGQDKEKTV